MPTLTITKNYSDGNILTESELDDIKTSVETFVNTTKLDSTNIQTGGIDTANYAALSVDSAALAASAVSTAKIADSAVTTAKILDAAVTQTKRAALGQQVSSSSGNFTTGSTSFTDVTNLSVTITTTGRPVFLSLNSDGTGNGSEIGIVAATGATSGSIKILRGSTNIYQAILGGGTAGTFMPPSAVICIDTPSAGTYTYKIQCSVFINTASFTVQYAQLVAFEL
jgi:hypothetical protein